MDYEDELRRLETNGRASKQTEAEIKAALAESTWDFKREIPEPPHVISIGGYALATEGNIMTVVGHSKSGKSAIAQALVAGMINPYCDTLGFNVQPNTEGRPIIYVDTEQSAWDFDKAMRRILIRASEEVAPECFKAFNLTGRDGHEALDIVEAIPAKIQAPKYHAIILDGGADLLDSVNDELEAKKIINLHTDWARTFQCPVITILHLNPGSEFKSRGHYGSALERKSQTVIQIDRQDDIHLITSRYQRSGPIFDPIPFTWGTDEEMFVSVGADAYRELQEARASEVQKEKLNRKRAEWRTYFETSSKDGMTREELAQVIATARTINIESAKHRIRRAEVEGLIIATDGRFQIRGGIYD